MVRRARYCLFTGTVESMAHPADNSGVIKMVDERVAYAVEEATSPLTSQLAAAQNALTAEKAKTAAVQKQYDDHMATHTTAPVPTKTMVLGVSATPGTFAVEYPKQVVNVGAKGCFYYGKPGERVYWGNSLKAVPDDHIIWLQTKDVGLLDLSTFPRTRNGKVYLHYWQEPEDDIEKGNFTLAEWQRETDALYAKMDGANLPYLVRSVHLMSWDVTLFNKGGVSAARNPLSYIRSRTQHVGYSVYAMKKVSNGHEVAGTKPTVLAPAIGAFQRAKAGGLPWSASAAGFAIGDAYVKDAVTVQNRVAWTEGMAVECAKAGSGSFLWFDIDWDQTVSDYRLVPDPALHAAWMDLPEKIKAAA
jgi:hypothetical protein